MNYKPLLLEEIYVCMKYLKLSYSDVLKMPTYERRFFLITYQNELVEAKERAENEKRNKVVKTGKWTQKRTI